jgi:AraC-like DNA-binding protein
VGLHISPGDPAAPLSPDGMPERFLPDGVRHGLSPDGIPDRFSTDDIPERDRFPFWAETMRTAYGLEAQPLPDASGPFRGHVSGRANGPLLHFDVAADAHRIVTLPRGGARWPRNGYRIYREASAGAWFRLANLEGVTQTGDLVVYDADLPFETQPREGYRHELMMVPKLLLDPHVPALGRPLAVMLSGHSGVQALAASYLDALVLHWDSISATTMVSAADTLGRLIGVACGAVAAEQPDAIRAGRLIEAKRHIDRHLANPALSPASVAAALGMSVRTLYLLFEPTGTSFARHVLRRRLEECRMALLGSPARPVTDIAFAWGFDNLSTFYRAFQAAFGVSPGDLRAASRGEPRS